MNLSGYKSYIIAALLGLTAAMNYLGFMDTETMGMLTVLLTGGGIAALRDGIAKK